MMRTAIGLSFLVALAFGSAAACSSEPTSNSSTAGSSGSGGNGTAGTAGSNGRAGSAGAGGAGSALCAGKMNMCLDDQTVQGCDPLTGMDVTANCEEDVPEGLINLGCGATDEVPPSEACLLDIADLPCWDGAQVFGLCAQLTDQEFVNVYLNCFNKLNEADIIVPCLAPYWAETTVDCDAAALECLPDAGAGGAGGEGPGLGAGGDPGAGGAN